MAGTLVDIRERLRLAANSRHAHGPRLDIVSTTPAPIDVAAEVRAAEQRSRPYLLTTPAVPSIGLTAAIGSEVVLKCENLQHTGSFKARGAVSKVLSLTPDELERGVITASTGNHGVAVAYAGSIVGVAPTVVVPDNANPSKLAAIERLGGRIEVHGTDSVESELGARRAAGERGLTFVSPYNDPAIILSLIHISEPTRPRRQSRMPCCA